MERVTLGNQAEFDKLRKELKKPESFKDMFERNSLKKSLEDSGISTFKEITDLNQISFGHFILIEKILG